jgi:hypothetical protein
MIDLDDPSAVKRAAQTNRKARFRASGLSRWLFKTHR